MRFPVALALLALVAVAVAQENPIAPFEQNSRLIKSVPNGKLFKITADSVFAPVDMNLIHLWGTPQQMGFAHGQLLPTEITDFMQKKLPDYIVSEVENLDLSKLPEWLQKLIKDAAPAVAPAAVKLALEYILSLQAPHMEKTAPMLLAEMDAVADGVCAATGCKDPAAMRTLIRSNNLFPDLVRMSCSVVGSWGSANAPGHEGLIQSRLLDFGAGPFPNATTIIVQHPSEGNPFVSVAFPGFVGVVTGISNRIALSEKVWMISGEPGTQDGTYDGEADVMVMRRMLQFAQNIDEAVETAHSANRTWAIFLGAGGYKNSAVTGKPIRIMTYRQKDVNDYDDVTIGTVTKAPYIENVAYVDKHPQPSRADDLPHVMMAQHGNITAEWTVQNVPRRVQSGDSHIAIYDMQHAQLFVSAGRTTPDGQYPATGGGQAYSRTFISFDLTRVLNERP